MFTETQKSVIKHLEENTFPNDVATHYNNAKEVKIHTDDMNANQIIACAEAIQKHNLNGKIKRSGAGLTVIFSSLN